MTYPIRIEVPKKSIVKLVDSLRILANVLGLVGVSLIVLAAGASDAGTLSITDILLTVALGAGLCLTWRVLGFFAREKSKELHFSLHAETAARRNTL